MLLLVKCTSHCLFSFPLLPFLYYSLISSLSSLFLSTHCVFYLSLYFLQPHPFFFHILFPFLSIFSQSTLPPSSDDRVGSHPLSPCNPFSPYLSHLPLSHQTLYLLILLPSHYLSLSGTPLCSLFLPLSFILLHSTLSLSFFLLLHLLLLLSSHTICLSGSPPPSALFHLLILFPSVSLFFSFLK